MPYEVQIKITSEADLKALGLSEEATKKIAAELKSAGAAAQQSGQQQQQAAQKSAEAHAKQEKAAINAHKAILPLAAGVAVLTQALQSQNPAVGAAVNVIDNFAIGAIAAGAATGGWTGALNVLKALLNPWTALVIAGGAVLAYFITRAQQSREATEAWSKSLEAMRGNLATLNAMTEQQKIAARVGKDHAAAADELRAQFDAGKISAAEYAQRLATLKVAFEGIEIAENKLRNEEVARANALARAQAQMGGPLNETQKINLELAARIRDIESQRIAPQEKAQQIAVAQIDAAAKRQSLEKEVADQLRAQLDELRAESVLIDRGEEAQKEYLRSIEAGNLARRTGLGDLSADTQMLRDLVTQEAERLRLLREQETAHDKILSALEAQAAFEATINNGLKANAEEAFGQRGRISDIDAQILRAAGAPDALLLQQRIDALQQQLRDRQSNPLLQNDNEIEALQKNIQLAQIELYKLQNTGIDIAGEVGRVVTDITGAVIAGTLKSADIGRSIMASFVRVGLETFTNFLRQMTQQQQFAQVAAAGGMALPGSQAASGAILPGGGGAGGGLFGLLGNLSSTSIGNSTLGGLGLAGLGGFGLSSILGGSGTQNLFSSLGSIGGSLLGSIPLGTVGIGGSIYSGFSASGIIGDLASSVFGSTIGGAIGNFLLPGIGSIIGMLLGGLFQKIPDPSVWVKTIIKFYYDALTQSFGAFSQATIVKFKDISGGKAQQVLAEHQKIMDQVSKQFVDILNAFPTAVHAPIEAALADANQMLALLLGNKKYSDLGSRNIQQELADLQHHEAPAAMFNSLREAIGIGLRETFKLSGFDFTDIISRQFAPLLPTLLGRPGGNGFFGGRVDAGLFADTDPDKRNAFFASLSKLAGFGGTLASISPRGVAPFLSDADLVKLQGELQRVFESPTEGFATAVDDMITRLQPLSDFLKNAVTESTNIFSRGMIAALDAATASQAYSAFQQNLGTGIKDKIFSGITEAFVASAQFTDLLAPIQKVIREFTQQALDTGQTPDLDAFRRAILPGIEDISTRAETLRPLIEELQKLGFDVRDALRSLSGGGAAAAGPVTINVYAADAQSFYQDLSALLRGRGVGR